MVPKCKKKNYIEIPWKKYWIFSEIHGILVLIVKLQ